MKEEAEEKGKRRGKEEEEEIEQTGRGGKKRKKEEKSDNKARKARRQFKENKKNQNVKRSDKIRHILTWRKRLPPHSVVVLAGDGPAARSSGISIHQAEQINYVLFLNNCASLSRVTKIYI